MKALLLTEYKHLELTEMPEPEIAPDEILVRVKACGICGSDIHGFDGSSGRRIPPLVMGHEAAGVVAARGSGVTDIAVGERVTFDSTVYCGACVFCRKGKVNLCENRQVLGVSCGDYRRHGAFAEYVAVPRRTVCRLPDNMRFEQAALIEAVSIAVHAVERTPVSLGDTAVVVGSGMIGLLVVQALKLAGCSRVIAVDLEDRRLELARKLGASATLNAKQADVVGEVRRQTDGLGADIAMEVVGASAPLQTAMNSVRKGGAVTMIGNLTPTTEFPQQVAVTRELTLYGSCASAGEYPRCVELVASGAIQVDPIISATASLEEGPAWFQRLYRHEGDVMKVVLQP